MFGLFRGPSAPRAHPTVELLEDRRVPTVFSVTTLADSGAGSLRQAVLDANNHLGKDVITFSPGLSGTIVLTTDDLDVTDDLVIQGPGANLLAVSGNQARRIFDIDPAGPSIVTLRVQNLKLTLGLATGAGNDDGGAVRVADNILKLRDCIVSGNQADDNGGAVASRGVVTAINTTFANNHSAGDGGALYLNGGLVRVKSCQLLNNTADGDGGGLYGKGDAQVRFSVVSGNTAAGEGGGIEWSGGTLLVRRTTVSDNTAAYGGGLSVDGGRLDVRASTISGNRATGNGTDGGAGLFLRGIETLIVNSTISGNLDQTTNPTADTGGGGIHAIDGNTVIRNSTIAFNSTVKNGGGIFLQGPFARLLLASTIVSDSTADGGLDVVRTAGEGKVSTVNSLIETLAADLINKGSTNTITGLDPMLAALADNGGPTRTHALNPLSPAINAGGNPDLLKWDQRGNGFYRVKDGGIDIGAFEL